MVLVVALGLATGTKGEMLQRIQDYFKYHPEDANSARYSGLFGARRGRRTVVVPAADIQDPLPPKKPTTITTESRCRSITPPYTFITLQSPPVSLISVLYYAPSSPSRQSPTESPT